MNRLRSWRSSAGRSSPRTARHCAGRRACIRERPRNATDRKPFPSRPTSGIVRYAAACLANALVVTFSHMQVTIDRVRCQEVSDMLNDMVEADNTICNGLPAATGRTVISSSPTSRYLSRAKTALRDAFGPSIKNFVWPLPLKLLRR